MSIKKKRNLQIKPFIPNVITILSLCAGLTSIRLSFENKWELSVFAILFAGVMDFLDGGVARLLNVKSKMGEFLDSLADMVSFGVAPIFCVYHFALHTNVRLGWAAALYFSVCMALRLARFNATLTDETPNKFFVGVPAPSAGYLILIPIFFYLETGFWVFQSFILSFTLVLITGMLMLSHIPTFSLKNIVLSRRQMRLCVLAFLLFVALLYSHPWLMLGVLGLCVVCSIPVSYNYYKKYISDN